MWNFRSNRRIYLDYASAPPVRDEALAAMHAAERLAGNPGAVHREGVEAHRALEDARDGIARLLEVKAREIIFTGGLTESNNIAVLGAARALSRVRRTLAGTHWIVSAIEHTSVLDCFAEIEALGGTVEHVLPDRGGIVGAPAVERLLRPETVLVSVGWANNEIGTIQPLSKIVRAIHAHEAKHGTVVLLHADAGQAPLYEPTTAHSLGVDLLALGGNKLYGPHGVGALYLSNRAELARTMQGGPQERGLRPGTEHVALAAGFAAAFEACARERKSEARRLGKLRDQFAQELAARIPGLVVNGDIKRALPHMLNISIPHIKSEYVVLALDAKGIAASTKSACREGEESESHVVAALGASEAVAKEERAQNTIRFSLGRETSAGDLERAGAALSHAVELVQK